MVLRHLGLEEDRLAVCDRLVNFVYKIDQMDSGVRIEGFKTPMAIHKCNPVAGNKGEFDRRFNILVELMSDALIHSVGEEDLDEKICSLPQVQEWVQQFEESQEASRCRVREVLRGAEQVAVFGQFEPALASTAHEAKAETLYTIFPSPSGEWMVQQIPTEAGGFTGRKPLPTSWAGKRRAELDEVTGIPGCIFCHPGRFIGGHKILEGAVAMAKLAIAAEESS
jgi:uncharacterized UPF0160 family protein